VSIRRTEITDEASSTTATISSAVLQIHSPISVMYAGCGLNDAESKYQCVAGFLSLPVSVGVLSLYSSHSFSDARAKVIAKVLHLGRRRLINYETSENGRRSAEIAFDYGP
jgi:hypothetical protein